MGNKQLSFMTACDIGDSLIAIDELGVGMFRIDKSDMSSHLIAELEDMGKRRNVYQASEQYNNEVFFFPVLISVDYRVIVYHLDSQSVEYLDLRSVSDSVFGNYEPLYRMGNYIWMFPHQLTENLLKFRLDTRQIEVVPQWRDAVKDIELGYADPWAKAGNLIEIQGALYHTIKGTNLIIKIDLNDCNVESYEIPTEAKFYIRMNYDGEKFWIVEDDNQGVISWNPIDQKVRRYPIMFPETEQKHISWAESILCGKKYLWLIPQRDKLMIRMDYETGAYECIEIFPKKFCVRKGNNRVFGMILQNGVIADLYPLFGNLIVHLDLLRDKLLEDYEQILLPEEWSESDLERYQLCHEFETDRISFRAYTDMISNSEQHTNSVEECCSNGDNIWRQITDKN
ncbi:MAG: hypothetical protein K2L82_03005 [Lachnospiraceae bacterium]|nr:hypothetical protein [Lachnospiraceae bacterium]